MKEYTFRNFYIPERMMDGIDKYINNRILPGSFLVGIIINDLRMAVESADDENMRNIPAYVAYFVNHAPMTCWGSEDAMVRWIQNVNKVNNEVKD